MAMGKIYKKKAPAKNMQELSKKVKRLERNVNKPEFKYHDAFQTSTITATGPIYHLNAINDSVTESGRIGSTVRIKSILLKGNLFLDALADNNVVRVLIVMGLHPDKAMPTYLDIMSSAVNLYTTICPRNLDNKHAFLIMYDKTFGLNSGNNQAETFEWYKKVDFISQYDQSAGGIANTTHHPLYLILVSNSSVNPPLHATTVRLRYIDN